MIELLDEIFEVDATDGVGESGEVCASGQIHAAGAGEIAFFEVEEGDGGLDESLEERLFRAGEFAPEIFQHIMAFEVVTGVEESDAFIDTGIKEVAIRHGSYRADYSRMGSTSPEPD